MATRKDVRAAKASLQRNALTNLRHSGDGHHTQHAGLERPLPPSFHAGQAKGNAAIAGNPARTSAARSYVQNVTGRDLPQTFAASHQRQPSGQQARPTPQPAQSSAWTPQTMKQRNAGDAPTDRGDAVARSRKVWDRQLAGSPGLPRHGR